MTTGTEGHEHEETLGPNDPGSMAFILAEAAEAPRQAAEAEAAPAIEEPEVPVEAIAAPEESETPPEPPEPKDKDWTVEDYKKALKEAETRMHTATTETATERKAREDLAAEMELTKQELATVRTEQEAAAAEVAKTAPKAERKAAFAEALKKIQDIPLSRGEDGEVVYPPDYDDLVAEAWAGTSVDPQEVAKEAAKLAREELKRERQVEDTRTAAEKAEATRLQIRVDAEKMAAEQGLDMTPGSADYDLFYVRVDKLANDPNHEYRDKPFGEQVKWATSSVKQALGKKIELTDAERAAALKNQTRNAVLERGITRQVTAEPTRQPSMSEILDELKAEAASRR